MSDSLEQTAGLAGAGHRDEQGVEDLRVGFHGAAERQPRLDVLAHLDDRFLEELVVGLFLEHVQGAQDRQTGGDHGGELTREDRELAGLDRLDETQLDLARGVLVGDVEHDHAARLQLV